MNSKQIDRRTAILAAISAGAGAVVVVALFVLQSDPHPLWLWGTFAVAFVILEFWSVEVNDRLFISSSIMVAFCGMVVFDRDSAVLAVTLMAAVAVLHPEDLRLRRWRQPAYNFGQLVLSTAIGALVLYPFLPQNTLLVSDIPVLVGGAALASLVYNWVNFRLVALYVKVAYPDRSLRPWSRMLANHLVHAVLGAYGALIGVAYLLVGPAALPMVVGTFLIGHSGFAVYSRMRQAHEDTVSGFVKAVEALDPYTKGHTERVAQFCRMAGERLGLDPDQLEVLRWAALIHDVGKLAAPPDLISKEGPLGDEEQARLERSVRVVEELLGRVDFLAAAVAAISRSEDPDIPRTIIARILGAADDFDLMTSTRSYRSARSQSAAFEQLRADESRHGADVVTSLIETVASGDVVYGPPDEETFAKVERLVQERSRRA